MQWEGEGNIGELLLLFLHKQTNKQNVIHHPFVAIQKHLGFLDFPSHSSSTHYQLYCKNNAVSFCFLNGFHNPYILKVSFDADVIFTIPKREDIQKPPGKIVGIK